MLDSFIPISLNLCPHHHDVKPNVAYLGHTC